MDLNCDLGEGESAEAMGELMRWIRSANIACGGHAGDLDTMRKCAAACVRFKVNAGAHPGHLDRSNFGRTRQPITPEGLKELLKEQVGALAAVLLEIGAPLHHVKLHGALYHQVEEDRTLAGAYVGWMMENWPGARLLARAGGLVQLEAMAVGAPVWRELFLDRGYMADGGLLPREEPGALLDARGARRRLELFRREGKIETVEGLYLRLEGESFCLHGDSPDAATVARIASEMMGP